jgi:hypothetical protein
MAITTRSSMRVKPPFWVWRFEFLKIKMYTNYGQEVMDPLKTFGCPFEFPLESTHQ